LDGLFGISQLKWQILEGANQFNVLLVPIGGGTSVSQALLCPQREQRCICSMDMGLMNRILAIDSTNMTATAESVGWKRIYRGWKNEILQGILGQHLESQVALRKNQSKMGRGI
jgi:hypothetical protein